MTRVVRVPLDDSRSFLAEVDDVHIPGEDLVALSRTDGPVDRPLRGLDESLDDIVPSRSVCSSASGTSRLQRNSNSSSDSRSLGRQV